MKALVIFAAATVIAAAAGTPPVGSSVVSPGDRFDHATHGAVTGDCANCHGGITSGGSAYPDASLCATCHDGNQMRNVTWSPPTGESAAGLAFSHTGHPALECAQCHQRDGELVRANVDGCLSCHGIAEHQNRITDGYGLIDFDENVLNSALGRTLHLQRRLVSLDLEDHVALADLIAHLNQAIDDRSFFHRLAKLR